MGYNSKSYRKFLASSVAAAAVVSAVAPFAPITAEAATNNFSDVKADAWYKNNVEYLVGNGVLDGFTDGTFRPIENVTRAQAAKMLAVSLGLEVTETPKLDFKDTKNDAWYAGYVAALVDAGIVEGYEDGTFKPNASITRAAFAKMVVEAYNLEKDATAKVELNDLVPGAWYEEYVTTLFSLGVVGGKGAGKFEPNSNVTRAESAAFLHRTEVEEVRIEVPTTAPVAAAVESVSAIDVNKVEVKFSVAVDPTKVKVALKKGLATQYTTATFSADNTSVVLEAPSAIPADDYEVVVTGLGDAEIKEAIKIEAAVETAIEIYNTEAIQNAAAPVSFKVANQYGTDMKVASNTTGFDVQAFNVTQNAAVVVTKSANSDFTLALDTAKIGDEVRVIVTHKGITTTKILKVVEPGKISAVELRPAELPANAKRVTVSDTGIVLPYTLKDQYGKEVKLTASQTGASAIATADGVTFLSSDAAIVDPATISTDANGVLKFNAGSKAGTATITAVINSTGAVATSTVTVSEAPKVAAVAVSAPTKLVAAGETVELDLVVTDQFGDVIKNDDAKVAALTVTEDANSTASIVKGKLQVTADKAGSTSVKILNGTTEVGNVTFNIEAAAVPTAITSVDVSALYENTATDSVTASDIKTKDQYGREYTLTGAVKVTAKDGTFDTVTIAESVTANGTLDTAETLTFTGTATAGNEVVVFELANGAKFETTLGSVDSADITSYSIKTVPALYAQGATPNAAYDVALELVGKTSAGNEVALAAGKVTNSTTSNSSVAEVTSAGVVTGLTKGSAVIGLWNGATKLAETNVTVSDEAPVAKSANFINASDLTVAATFTVDAAASVEVLDQYGVKLALDGFFTSSDSNIATVNATNGVVTGVAAGEAVITYVTKNGIVTTTKVVVTP